MDENTGPFPGISLRRADAQVLRLTQLAGVRVGNQGHKHNLIQDKMEKGRVLVLLPRERELEVMRRLPARAVYCLHNSPGKSRKSSRPGNITLMAWPVWVVGQEARDATWFWSTLRELALCPCIQYSVPSV